MQIGLHFSIWKKVGVKVGEQYKSTPMERSYATSLRHKQQIFAHLLCNPSDTTAVKKDVKNILKYKNPLYLCSLNSTDVAYKGNSGTNNYGSKLEHTEITKNHWHSRYTLSTKTA
jgi:hypothetical protein